MAQVFRPRPYAPYDKAGQPHPEACSSPLLKPPLVQTEQAQDANGDQVQGHDGAEQARKRQDEDACNQGDQGGNAEMKRHKKKTKGFTQSE